jgi:hypothetical protein
MVGVQQVVIPSGQALSNSTDLNLSRLCGVMLPSAWTTADISFQASFDGATWVDVFSQTAEYTIPSAVAAPSRLYVLDPQLHPWHPLPARQVRAVRCTCQSGC